MRYVTGVLVVSLLGWSCRSEFVAARFELTSEQTSELRQGLHDVDGGMQDLPDGGVGPCALVADHCTPTNLSGRIFSGGAMWGQLGPEAQNLTLIGATEAVILNPSEGIGGTLTFSLVEATRIASSYWAPPPGPEAQTITRMEFNYDFLDATLVLPEPSPLAGEYVIRTVFVSEATSPDVSGSMKQGDKLLRKASESTFRWCNSTTCSAQRDQVETGLVQQSKLLNYQFPGQGNRNYIPFPVPLKNAFSISADQLNVPNQLWEVSFDMRHAITFHTLPQDITAEAQLLNAFELAYTNDSHGGSSEAAEMAVSLRLIPGP